MIGPDRERGLYLLRILRSVRSSDYFVRSTECTYIRSNSMLGRLPRAGEDTYLTRLGAALHKLE